MDRESDARGPLRRQPARCRGRFGQDPVAADFRDFGVLRQAVFAAQKQVVDEADAFDADESRGQVQARNMEFPGRVVVVEQEKIPGLSRPVVRQLVMQAQHSVHFSALAPATERCAADGQPPL